MEGSLKYICKWKSKGQVVCVIYYRFYKSNRFVHVFAVCAQVISGRMYEQLTSLAQRGSDIQGQRALLTRPLVRSGPHTFTAGSSFPVYLPLTWNHTMTDGGFKCFLCKSAGG